MFTRRWIQCLPWCRPVLRRSAQRVDDHELPQPEDRPLGCGWFDSSHDLQQGLQVREADAQGLAQLPLADWLALHLRSSNRADNSGPADAGMITTLTLH